MSKNSFSGVTPVGGSNPDTPSKGPVILFTQAHLRCPCDPDQLQEVFLPGTKYVTCVLCGAEYDLPKVSYRWPPPGARR